MKKGTILFLILAVVFLLWGFSDLYNHLTVGLDALQYYDNSEVIRELVNYNLMQAFIKIAIGSIVLLVLFVIGKMKKTQK